jgi:hypothetical protein
VVDAAAAVEDEAASVEELSVAELVVEVPAAVEELVALEELSGEGTGPEEPPMGGLPGGV